MPGQTTERGGRDSNASGGNAPEAEKKAADALPAPAPNPEPARGSRPLADDSLRFAQPNPELSDAELERGILDAVRAGLGDVARVLASQLEARQRARAGTVVNLDAKRRQREG